MSNSFINANSVKDIKTYMLQPAPIVRQNATINYHESPPLTPVQFPKPGGSYSVLLEDNLEDLEEALSARGPPSTACVPLPPREWLEEEMSMEIIKKQILKKIYNLIKSYPGKHCSNQISKILGLDFDPNDNEHRGYNAMRACNELVKNGYIRQTSAGGFIAIKPFA